MSERDMVVETVISEKERQRGRGEIRERHEGRERSGRKTWRQRKRSQRET